MEMTMQNVMDVAACERVNEFNRFALSDPSPAKG